VAPAAPAAPCGILASVGGMSRAGRRAVVVLVVVLSIAVFRSSVSWLESKLVFLPYRGEDTTPAALGIPYRAMTIVTSDGERVIGWQLEPERPRADVVYFHGNGGNLSVWLPILASLHRHGLRVFAIDYRGYGLSSGSPTEDGVYRDAEAAVAHARAHRPGNTSRPLVYWGRSLGGPIAATVARSAPPDGLVLESTFPDKAAVLRRQPLLRALNVFSSYRFSTVNALDGFPRPVLVMHGDRDSVIPFALGRELFDRIAGPKQFAVIRGGDHNDHFDASHEQYWSAVMAFVASLGGAAGADLR
jgi:fermentation-respiration switch protein FrsA (DUF1100 family)